MRLAAVLLALSLAALGVRAESPPPFPVAIGGPFALNDQRGEPRTEADPEGRMQLLFFGYANCRQICSVALPLMAEAADLAAARGVAVRPVMITVDPARDTPAFMGETLEALHPDFLGLTGDTVALDAAYGAFGIAHEVLFQDPFEGPIFAHGSHIYLLDAQGRLMALVPPVLSVDRVVDLIVKYAPQG